MSSLSDDYCNVIELIIAALQTTWVRSSGISIAHNSSVSNPTVWAPGMWTLEHCEPGIWDFQFVFSASETKSPSGTWEDFPSWGWGLHHYFKMSHSIPGENDVLRCQQNCCYWDEIGPEKNEGFNLWLTTGRLSQQFRIYCVGPGQVWIKSFCYIWWKIHSHHTEFSHFDLLPPRWLDDLKPPNTKMKRMIWDFGITNVLRNDDEV